MNVHWCSNYYWKEGFPLSGPTNFVRLVCKRTLTYSVEILHQIVLFKVTFFKISQLLRGAQTPPCVAQVRRSALRAIEPHHKKHQPAATDFDIFSRVRLIKIRVKIAVSMVNILPKSLKLCLNLLYVQVLILINNINCVITPSDT